MPEVGTVQKIERDAGDLAAARRSEPEQLERQHEEPEPRRCQRQERADRELGRDGFREAEALDVPRDWGECNDIHVTPIGGFDALYAV